MWTTEWSKDLLGWSIPRSFCLHQGPLGSVRATVGGLMENSGIQHRSQIPFRQKLICFHAGGQAEHLCLSQEEGVGRGLARSAAAGPGARQ